MPFVKFDCKMLDSSIWPEKDQRDLFITALLMAEPFELREPTKQIQVRSLEYTDFMVPIGWYGFVPAAGVGIIHRCGIDLEIGLTALEKLGSPDAESRSHDFEGRRLVRIDGGYLLLNYDRYRERDYSNAERCKRYREKKKNQVNDTPCQPSQHACQHVSDMQAEAEAEVEAEEEKNTINPPASKHEESFLVFWKLYPKKKSKEDAKKAWNKLKPDDSLFSEMIKALEIQRSSKDWVKDGGQYIPFPSTWLNGKLWEDEIEVSGLKPQLKMRASIV